MKIMRALMWRRMDHWMDGFVQIEIWYDYTFSNSLEIASQEQTNVGINSNFD